MAITAEQFAVQRSPRRGIDNPERMDMRVWEWLVREGISAYEANEKFGGPGVLGLDRATVRYVDERDAVLVKVEGALDAARARELCDDLVAKLSALQRAACVALLEGRQE